MVITQDVFAHYSVSLLNLIEHTVAHLMDLTISCRKGFIVDERMTNSIRHAVLAAGAHSRSLHREITLICVRTTCQLALFVS